MADSNSDSVDHELLNEIVAEYLDAVARGIEFDREKLLSEYPQFEHSLIEFFRNHDAIVNDKPESLDSANECDSPAVMDEETICPTMESSASSSGHEHATTLGNPIPKSDVDHSDPSKVRYFGDYEILNEIARGGMGIVYRARQVSLNRIVALKMIIAGQFADQEEVSRFATEAEAAANLDHSGIVTIFEVGEHNGQHFYSMPFVDGVSLTHALSQGPLDARTAAKLLASCANAVGVAHANGVIHRDLKPSNILLDKEGKPRITDFGLAKRIHDDHELTATGQILGTPSFMPPEQASGAGIDIDHRSDIYSLGAVLYNVLTGKPPFQAANPIETIMQLLESEPVPPRKLNSRIPKDLETICLKCLQHDSRRRYQSCDALSDDLNRWLDGRPISARPASVTHRCLKWIGRRPATFGLLSVSSAALILLVIAGIVATLAIRDREQRTRYSWYVSDINLARTEIDGGQFGPGIEALDRQRPRQGEEDLRGPEWHLLMRQANQHLAQAELGSSVTSIAQSTATNSLVVGTESDGWFVVDSSTLNVAHQTEFPRGHFWLGNQSASPNVRMVHLPTVGTDEVNEAAISALDTSAFLESEPFYVSMASRMAPDGAIHLSMAPSGDYFVTFHDEYMRRVLVAQNEGDLTQVGVDPFQCRFVWHSFDGSDETELQVHRFKPNAEFVCSQTGDMIASPGLRRVGLANLQSVIAILERDKPDPLYLEVTPATDAIDALDHETIRTVCFSSDCQFLAVAMDHGSIDIWSLETQQRLHSFSGGSSAATQLRFFNDDRHLLVGHQDARVTVRDIETGRLLNTYSGHDSSISYIHVLTGERQFVSADNSGVLKRWSFDGSRQPVVIESRKTILRQVRFLLGEDALVIDDPGQNTLEGNNPAPRPQVYGMQDGIPLNVTVKSADPTATISCDGQNEIELRVERSREPDEESPYSLHARITFLDSYGEQSLTRKAAYPLARFRLPAEIPVSFHPSLMTLALFDADASVIAIHDIAIDRRRDLNVEEESEFSSLAFSNDGRWLVALDDAAKSVQVWNLETRELVHQYTNVVQFALSPDGATMAIVGITGITTIRSLKSGGIRKQISLPIDELKQLYFLGDESRLLTVARQGGQDEASIWDLRTGQSVYRFPRLDSMTILLNASRDRLVIEEPERISIWNLSPWPD